MGIRVTCVTCALPCPCVFCSGRGWRSFFEGSVSILFLLYINGTVSVDSDRRTFKKLSFAPNINNTSFIVFSSVHSKKTVKSQRDLCIATAGLTRALMNLIRSWPFRISCCKWCSCFITKSHVRKESKAAIVMMYLMHSFQSRPWEKPKPRSNFQWSSSLVTQPVYDIDQLCLG